MRRKRAVIPALAALFLVISPAGVAQTGDAPGSRSGTASATPALNTSNSLRVALDAAWALHPASRASGHRAAELDARARAAQSFISGSPSVGLAHRTDALSGDVGLREYEAEVEVPLWNPGMRDATQSHVVADTAALVWQQSAERLTLAGAVREAAAQVALARAERDSVARKHLEATQLADDIERRVQAGDSARVDALQARAGAQQAQSQLLQSEALLLRVLGQWRVLTGQSQVADLDEPLPSALLQNPMASAQTVQSEHPALQAAQAQVRSAQARLALTEADRRDPMALGVGVTRERAAAGANLETALRFALRIPLGGDSRNASRLAAARAELDAAHAQADVVVRQTESGIAAAHADLDAARRQEALAAQRATLSTQMQVLVAKSHRLGESDLPTRMRADNEKFDADLSLARARIALQRAISQLNQSLGMLP